MTKPKFYIGLVHSPIYNKHHDIVTTSVTTIDVHDIARISKTFSIKRFYVITPIVPQQELAGKLIKHWKEGFGASYNPSRKAALKVAKIENTVEDAIADATETEGEKPIIVATTAQLVNVDPEKVLSAEVLREKANEGRAIVLLFGTGWGMTESVFKLADYVLEPIGGDFEFNHLPVRSAVSIYCDRLLGR